MQEKKEVFSYRNQCASSSVWDGEKINFV